MKKFIKDNTKPDQNYYDSSQARPVLQCGWRLRMAFLLSLFGAVAVQKNVRDIAQADEHGSGATYVKE